MTADRFAERNWCRYCSRPAVVTWAGDIRTCTQEVCQELAYALVRRLNRRRHEGDEGWPLVDALLRAERTLEQALSLDTVEELLLPAEAEGIRRLERQRTAAAVAAVRRIAPRPAHTAGRALQAVPAAVPRTTDGGWASSTDAAVRAGGDPGSMARDLFTRLDRCRYCDRRATIVWDGDVRTCGHEVCKALAFAELRRRERSTRPHAA